ncbi:Z-ring formation inhibitor MciZ [Paenibacillus naphthalenovorans]|uniref:Uncharacterized protein n=1 Tax=Paenibacillus naphthalenovorans TaxID=162209 RepID=A0A0U2W8I6_9BACL|nr:hypothetical protein IJ22_23930 [Paenibacillus naphthalenovorans]GCL70561.1 Z-ring formation inhibitor MciZ [Paenibacillus naphthalenovorans]SDH78365.1 Protein of unknown function [Paenibacillus naphthalenovorans]
MKTYVGNGQLRLVGKAWEVRQYLKMMLGTLSADQPLTAFLNARSAAELKNRLIRPVCPVHTSIADRQRKRHRKLLQKTKGLHVIPFPSK